MNDYVLEKCADFVDEAAIEKYLRYEEKIKKPSKFFSARNWKMAAISACIVLFVLGGFFAINKGLLQYPITDDTEQLFIIKTHAMNGELVEVDPYVGTYNSGYTGENLFGVDFPIFSFDVVPTALAEGKLKGFDIEVSVICDDKYNVKEHISVSYLFLQGETGGPKGYSILGWFEEPTDITVILTDKKTQKAIEEITINICYSEDREAYKLTVLDIDYNISQVIIHTSPTSSKLYVFSEKDEINNFLHKSKILDADYKHIANEGFDPALSLYGAGSAVEIQIVKNDGETVYFYMSRGGVVYKQSGDMIVYTDKNTVDYYELIALLK